MSENLHKRRSSMRTRGFGVCGAQKLLNKLNALGKGKRVMELIPNPDPTQTNKPFIRVRRKLEKSLFSKLQLISTDLHACFLPHKIHEDPNTLFRVNCIHRRDEIGKRSCEHFNAISLVQAFGWEHCT